MPLKIVETPEPLSENSLSEFEARKPLLIGSDASRVLESELRDYCDGNIAGRSFLIAGHRGAGKSTLVANAFLEVWNAFQGGEVRRRPLFVPLSGPSLFFRPPVTETANNDETSEDEPIETEEDAEEEAEDDNEVPDAAKPTTRAGKTEAQVVLEQIVLGLHRAVTREFSRSYWEHARVIAERPGSTDTEVLQLAAQFDAELMDCPEPSRLSEFYRLADLHSRGLLSRSTLSRTAGSAAELVALSGISDAYKRISGDYAREDRNSNRLSRTATGGIGSDASMKDFVNASLPLLLGGVTGVSVGAAGGANPLGILSGILAALGAVIVVKAATKRTTTKSRVENFIFDLSLATLDRILPVLIERLWRAGLAPMFVVDELDKVDDLSTRMRDVVHHLKKLVAENAFFCFLADRQYFEEMLDQTSNRAYPQEYTYYSHRLFVAFQAGDFETYLEEKLQIQRVAQSATGSLATTTANAPSTPTTAAAHNPAATALDSTAPPNQPPAEAAAPQSGATVQAVLARGQRDDDALSRDILLWALRHRSQLHPLDLRRALRALSDENSNVKVSVGDVLRTAYLIDVTIQVLIEALLGSTEVVQRISNNYESLRLIHDALYFITRQWLRGQPTLEINEHGKQVFVEYLEARTGRKQPHASNGEQQTAAKTTKKKASKKSKKRATSPAADVTIAGANGTSLSSYDVKFYFGLVRQLANALADGDAATKLIDGWQNPAEAARRPKRPLAGTVRQQLLLDTNEASVLHVVERGEEGVAGQREPTVIYEWRYDPAGTPRIAPSAAAAKAPEAPLTPVPQQPDAGARAEVAPPTATPSDSPTLPVWEQNWRDIQAFAKSLNASIGLSSQPRDSQLGYRRLARQFGLIPARPPWEEVEEAHRRLERGGEQGQAAIAADSKQLADFWTGLQARRKLIVRALVCAAAIGVASSPRERVMRGLEVLARALRFTEKDDNEVAESLDKVESELKARFPKLRDGRVSMPQTTREDALTKGLPEFIEQVESALPADDASWTQLRNLAWNDALTRHSALNTNGTLVDPSVPELLHACRDRGPSSVIDIDPRKMTAAQWTGALVAAVERPQTSSDVGVFDVPAWVGLAAMYELGFRANDTGLQRAMRIFERAFSSEKNGAALDLFRILLMQRPTPVAAILALYASPRSRLDWEAQPQRYLCLIAAPRQVTVLLEHGFPLADFMRSPRPLLAIEVAEEADSASSELDPSKGEPPIVKRLREGTKISFRPVYIYEQEPITPPPGPRVIAPTRFDDLLLADHRQAR